MARRGSDVRGVAGGCYFAVVLEFARRPQRSLRPQILTQYANGGRVFVLCAARASWPPGDPPWRTWEGRRAAALNHGTAEAMQKLVLTTSLSRAGLDAVRARGTAVSSSVPIPVPDPDGTAARCSISARA
jgi:hypothetical protein